MRRRRRARSARSTSNAEKAGTRTSISEVQKIALRSEVPTLVPDFDPALLAKEVEAAALRPTLSPSMDPSAYARIVETSFPHAEDTNAPSSDDTSLERAMCGRYLASDYPEALSLAERLIAQAPLSEIARLVLEACNAQTDVSSEGRRLQTSSIVRLTCHRGDLDPELASEVVLGHVDGVADVAMVAELSGLPPPEALDRLHRLLEVGVLEIVSA